MKNLNQETAYKHNPTHPHHASITFIWYDVIELSPRKIDHNDNIMESWERQRFQGKSVIIIEGGSKELKDHNGNNNPRKLSPAEAIKAKLGSTAHQLSAHSSSSHSLYSSHMA